MVFKMTLFCFYIFATLMDYVCSLSDSINDTQKQLEYRLDKLEEKLQQLENSLKTCVCENEMNAITNGSQVIRTTNAAETNVTENWVQCPFGWKRYNDSCWQYNHQPLNWSAARNVCVEEGGDLASLHSDEENKFLSNLRLSNFNDTSTTFIKTGDKCFIKNEQKILVGMAADVHVSVSFDKCLSLCSNLLNCSSFMYYYDMLNCILSDESRVTRPDLFFTMVTDKVDYYEKFPCNSSTTAEQCRNTYSDVIFLVDGSDNVGPTEFLKIKQFLKLFVDTTVVGSGKSQFGMVQFTDDQWLEFSLLDHQSNNAVKEAIDKMPYRQGGTFIGRALEFVIENQACTVGRRPEYPAYVVIVTDGISQDDPTFYAQLLHDIGVTVFAVGPTQRASKDKLIKLTGSETRVFLGNNFGGLSTEVANKLNEQICSASGTWIGFRDHHRRQPHNWSDGSPVDYVNWDPNQVDRKNCVMINNSPEGTWNNSSCQILRPYFCRMDVVSKQQTTTAYQPLLIVIGP